MVVGVLRQFPVIDLEHPRSLLDVDDVGLLERGLATVRGFGRIGTRRLTHPPLRRGSVWHRFGVLKRHPVVVRLLEHFPERIHL